MSHAQGIGQAQQGNQVYESRNVPATSSISQTGNAAQVSQTGSVSQTAGSGDDKAQLSLSGSSIAPTADGDVRADKVAALQSQIAAGTYNVSSSDVADKVISALLK
jgi:anti-sigma28 factor (negative regulator of flagellin synthesis)